MFGIFEKYKESKKLKAAGVVKVIKVLTLITSFALLSACDAEAEPAVTQTVSQVEARPAAPLNNITVSGIVESVERRNVYTTLGFRIDRVYVETGDQVQAGQVLASLDTANLELTIAQQRASIDVARQNSQNAIQDTRRMLSEATANLANNTNIHILNAEAALSAAKLNLTSVQQNYDDAIRDYNLGNNPQVLNAESLLRTARVELDRIERDHANFTNLLASGIITQDEMRQSENALTHARNQYNDARTSYENATQLQQRTIEQLRISLETAAASKQSAQEMLNAARVAAQQDIERLRSSVASAETGANLEHMEIALRQLERQLEESTITAPISGTVTAVIAREGATGMGLLFTVEDTDNLRIITSFREYDLGRVEQGMEVVITSNATGTAEYTGVISRINPAATPSSPVVEFEAEVTVTSADTGLRIGMNTRVSVALE